MGCFVFGKLHRFFQERSQSAVGYFNLNQYGMRVFEDTVMYRRAFVEASLNVGTRLAGSTMMSAMLEIQLSCPLKVKWEEEVNGKLAAWLARIYLQYMA
jgi:hypothetical protein